MRVGLSLLHDDNEYKITRINVFHITKVIPIDYNDIDKGTYLFDIQNNQLVSNWPIDKIELEMQEAESKMIALMLENMGLFVASMASGNKIKKTTRKKPTTRKR